MRCGHSADDWRDLHYDDRGDAYLDKCDDFERFEMSPDLEERCGFCVAMDEDTLDEWADELDDAVLIEDPAVLESEELKTGEGDQGREEEEAEVKGKGKARADIASPSRKGQGASQKGADKGKTKGGAASSSRSRRSTQAATSETPKHGQGSPSAISSTGLSTAEELVDRKTETKGKGKGKGKEKAETSESRRHRR